MAADDKQRTGDPDRGIAAVGSSASLSGPKAGSNASAKPRGCYRGPTRALRRNFGAFTLTCIAHVSVRRSATTCKASILSTSARSRNSIRSIRRSPFSYFETNDCGRLRRDATALCDSPAAFRALTSIDSSLW
jgi:hypothetical protein